MTTSVQRILVTGAAGFIASRVAALLLSQGYQVVGVDNLNDAYDVRLKEWRLAELRGHPEFTFHHLDITDRQGLQELFQALDGHPPFDAVVNLAARAGVRQSVANPWVYLETNVTGTLNLLELCREHRVPRFVLASTSSLYAGNDRLPYREDMPTDRPLSPYAASKKAAEALCHTYHALYGMDVVVLRYFTVYGPGGRPDMSLFRFVQWIFEERPVVVYGDGTQSRDFTYVDDVAQGTVAAIHYTGGSAQDAQAHQGHGIGTDSRSPIYEVINLGSDRPVVLMEAIRLVEALVGKEARLEHRARHPADALATWADIGKARQLLGWQPQTPFQKGVERLVAWYRENRSWARTIETGT